MISDPLALQYMVNSPHFAHGPILENGMNLMFDENCVMAVKGAVSCFDIDWEINLCQGRLISVSELL
jgi:hypothetical protein